ncbi:MAG: 4-(cytidine 5'-diphospho)-2-C-methyl-D-erythritol kinase [Clostridia bacterium]|nr:4-(cytidine 5'-diphospho)-2-C-methyl-D-erythritol kinase [Clostridia bacterium]
MDMIYKKARAKINLTLMVLNKREDNYHNIKSVFQKVNLYDELYIYKTDTDKLEIETNVESIKGDKNIIYKAYMKLKESYKIFGVRVVLKKKIPMQAGLAGGSTDCASFILGINELFGLGLSKEEMKKIGSSIGADVVPCFYNNALIAEGIGDIITSIDTDFKYYIVIVKPKFACDTGSMYKKIDEQGKNNVLDKTDEIVKGLKEHNVKIVADNLYNSFEETIADKEEIINIKNELIKFGAFGSLMTGSGSCVYGIFDSKKIAKNAYEKIKLSYETYICLSYNSKRGSYFDI